MSLAYSENVPLRLILTTAFPVGGSAIDIALTSYASQIYEKRATHALEVLKEETDTLNQQMLDKDFLQSESFFDLFRLYLEKSIQTRQNEKICYYARLVTDGITNTQTIEQTEQGIEKISLLSTLDLSVMNVMWSDNLRDPELFSNPEDFFKETSTAMKVFPDNLPEIEGLSISDVEVSINNLIAVGFVREYAGTAGSYKGGWYFVTPLLREIMIKLKKTL